MFTDRYLYISLYSRIQRKRIKINSSPFSRQSDLATPGPGRCHPLMSASRVHITLLLSPDQIVTESVTSWHYGDHHSSRGHASQCGGADADAGGKAEHPGAGLSGNTRPSFANALNTLFSLVSCWPSPRGWGRRRRSSRSLTWRLSTQTRRARGSIWRWRSITRSDRAWPTPR